MFLLTTLALAASPTFTLDTTDPAVWFADGTNRFTPTAPYASWRDVGDVSGDLTDVAVECPQGSHAQIRMNANGRVQMRALASAEDGAECSIFIDFAGGGVVASIFIDFIYGG